MEQSIQEKDGQYVVQTYLRAPFVLERGEGIYVYDTDGNEYLDFSSGIAVTALGHCDPEIVAAVQEQMATLGHVSNLYHTAPQAELAEQLCTLSFADRVFFCNSGAESIEAAIKFARRYARTVYGPAKSGLVSFHGAFHGRTMGALSLTPREAYQAPFQPLVPGAAYAPFNDLDAAERIIGPETCAVFVEPVQGEGGVNAATPVFLEGLRSLCDRFGALLVFDEIQCGLGRTGSLWAYEQYGVIPDMMALAKALGGGLPIGATLIAAHVADAIQPGDHGSTFAAGPLACRAAQVVVKRVRTPATLAHIQEMGQLLADRLAEINSPHILEVRGRGLMVGVQLDVPATPLIAEGHRRGLIMLNAGPNVLRLLPPYVVQAYHIDRLAESLAAILASQP